jgi:hypothetical protein
MKKSLKLSGLLGMLLIAGMMFTACPTDGSDDGDGTPSPGSLPALPDTLPDGTNATYAATEEEAIALLTALEPVFTSVGNDVESLIGKAQNNGNWAISGDTSIEGIKVTSKGSYTSKREPENFMDEDWIPAVGHNGQMSSNTETTVDITADKTVSGVVVYAGSKVEQKAKSSQSFRITELSSSGAKVHISASGEESNVFSLTVSSGGKGGKIILNARQSGSLNNDFVFASEEDDFPEPSVKYSGSLTVYGDGNKAIYTLPIESEATYEAAMAYFE